MGGKKAWHSKLGAGCLRKQIRVGFVFVIRVSYSLYLSISHFSESYLRSGLSLVITLFFSLTENLHNQWSVLSYHSVSDGMALGRFCGDTLINNDNHLLPSAFEVLVSVKMGWVMLQ